MKYILVILTLISSTVFADTIPDKMPILYCPHHIDCTANGKLDSCHISDNPYGIWSNLANEGNVVKKRYELKIVSSKYQDSQALTRCHYSVIDDHGVEKIMHILAWSSNYYPSRFNALIGGLHQWSVVGWDAKCVSNDPKLCPLIEVPEVVYWDQDEITANNGFYSGFYWDELDPNKPNLNGSMSYNNLLSICGSSSICVINIGRSKSPSTFHSKKFERYGSMKINLSTPDTIQIVSINTDPDSPCILKKKEPFNTLYCEIK